MTIPPPRGICSLCELRSLGISNTFFIIAHLTYTKIPKYESTIVRNPKAITVKKVIVLIKYCTTVLKSNELEKSIDKFLPSIKCVYIDFYTS